MPKPLDQTNKQTWSVIICNKNQPAIQGFLSSDINLPILLSLFTVYLKQDHLFIPKHSYPFPETVPFDCFSYIPVTIQQHREFIFILKYEYLNVITDRKTAVCLVAYRWGVGISVKWALCVFRDYYIWKPN